MQNKEFFSTMEAAKILDISRIAVFQNIKAGKIKATQVGRSYIISKKELGNVLTSRRINR